MKRMPQRKCIACREIRDKKDLYRLVKTSEGEISLDLSGRMNGRGAYICRAPDCLRKALSGKLPERSLKAKLPEDVCQSLKEELEKIER